MTESEINKTNVKVCPVPRTESFGETEIGPSAVPEGMTTVKSFPCEIKPVLGNWRPRQRQDNKPSSPQEKVGQECQIESDGKHVTQRQLRNCLHH